MTDKIRDHLANERTFLAWVRTALGLMGLGFVMARMGLFLRELAQNVGAQGPGSGRTLGHEFFYGGIVFLVVATIMIPWAWWEYRLNLRAIEEDQFVPARALILLFTAVVFLGGLAIIGLMVERLLHSGVH